MIPRSRRKHRTHSRISSAKATRFMPADVIAIFERRAGPRASGASPIRGSIMEGKAKSALDQIAVLEQQNATESSSNRTVDSRRGGAHKAGRGRGGGCRGRGGAATGVLSDRSVDRDAYTKLARREQPLSVRRNRRSRRRVNKRRRWLLPIAGWKLREARSPQPRRTWKIPISAPTKWRWFESKSSSSRRSFAPPGQARSKPGAIARGPGKPARPYCSRSPLVA